MTDTCTALPLVSTRNHLPDAVLKDFENGGNLSNRSHWRSKTYKEPNPGFVKTNYNKPSQPPPGKNK